VSKFELIAAECADHDITKLTELLGVSPSGFYSWVDRQRRRELTPRQQRRRDLEVKILAHWQASTRTYGSPRITADLHAEGVAVSENKRHAPWPPDSRGRSGIPHPPLVVCGR
jgi:putative transposase